MEKPKTFVSLMRDHNITPDQFFNVQGITQQVKNNLSRFVKYCRTHQAFTQRMVTLALNISYEELDQISIKNASFAINDILSNEQPEIVQLFFQTDKKTSNQSTDIPQEIEGGIQSEAERLFNFDEDQQNQRQQQRPIQLKQYQVVTLSFQILKNPQHNQTCLGHLQKIYSYLIRHNPLSVLGLLNQNQQIRKLLLSSLKYSSVSSLVAQLLTSQDKTNEYTYQNLKKQIVQHVISQMFNNIEDELYFDGVMILIQELINTTKQSYYEYFDDFKRISKLLISKDIMKKFYDILLLKNEQSFRNVSKFLQYLFQRINTEQNQNNYYNKTQETDSLNHFEVEIFYQNLPALIDLVNDVQYYNSLTKISYLNFLYHMFTINKLKVFPFSINQPCFIHLLDCFDRQQQTGIYKNKLYQLIIVILSKTTNQETAVFLDNNVDFYDKYFKSIKNANYSNTKVYNKNQASGYDISIIHQFSKKNENVLNNATKSVGKDFKRICKKYQTKIATFQNNNNFVIQEQYSFEKFNLKNITNNQNSTKTTQNSQSSTGFSLNFVGKNNISIPILNIPDKSTNDFQDEKEDHRKQPKGYGQGEFKEIFEVEEVFNLREKIQTLTIKENNSYSPPSVDRTQQSQSLVLEKGPIKDLKLEFQTSPQIIQLPLQSPQKNQAVKVQQQKAIQPNQQKQALSESIPQNSKQNKQKPDQKEKIKFYSKHLVIFV